MIHLLVVGGEAQRLSASPAFEILRAAGAVDALEKLSRNRRIDAVLFFDPALAHETAGLLAEEDPAGPPLFLAGQPAVAGVTSLAGTDILRELMSQLGEA